MKQVLETLPAKIDLHGRVFSGIGEGAYYVSLKGYRKQFVQKLGFDPYPGTLNLRLSSPVDRRLRREMNNYRGITIEGFENGQRTYGAARCFPARLNDKVEGAILIIERTHYDFSVIEFIGPMNLRQKLDFKDGDEVTIRVSLTIDESRSS